jgi:hypothetical protein
MKLNLYKGSVILLAMIFFAFACKKSMDTSNQNTVINPPHDTTLVTVTVPYPISPTQECNYAPDYGDSVVYPEPVTNGDFYTYPQNNQGIQGTYLSWPGGLSLNPNTGAIDLTRSQTGERYSVAFVKSGTTDTCLSELIVAGVAYMDSVYVLSQSDTTSTPYFNANPYGPSPCASNQGQGCQFDYNNFAQNQGIIIDQKTGFIDLQQTMKKSPFGILPLDGTTVYTTIYYKLNDNSNYAPQSIQLQMVYYNHKSSIPAGILASVTNKLINTLGDLLLSKGPSPRPPLILIVRDNQ